MQRRGWRSASVWRMSGWNTQCWLLGVPRCCEIGLIAFINKIPSTILIHLSLTVFMKTDLLAHKSLLLNLLLNPSSNILVTENVCQVLHIVWLYDYFNGMELKLIMKLVTKSRVFEDGHISKELILPTISLAKERTVLMKGMQRLN